MTRRWFKVAGLACLPVVALLAWSAHARGWGHRDPERFQRFLTHRVNDLMDDIQATEPQRGKVHAAVGRMLDLGRLERAAGDETRAALIAELRSDRPNKDTVHRLVAERAEKLTTLAHQAADAALEVHGALTPAQRAEVLDEFEQHGHGPRGF